MISFDLEVWLAEQRSRIDTLLDQRLALLKDDPGRLNEAMRYSLLAPGKRLRPLLVLASAQSLSAPLNDAIFLAAGAVELVHCYSLIHDDLPAMDNDNFRRGKPTNHKIFGEAMAILAGDALLTLAFQWLAEAGQESGSHSADRALGAVLALARGAGMKGMVRGQARDITPKLNPTLEDLETLHQEKTGALFRAAMEVGASMAGATPAQYEALAHFGSCYGIAFQHRDDQSDNENLGFAELVRKRIPELCSEAIRSLQGFGENAEVLRTMALRLDPG